MNIVSFALRRPVSLVVAVAAIVLAALLAIHRMPRDIFPDLGVPVIYVAQTYGGLDPAQMVGFLVNYYEYHFLYIDGIEHVESKSIQGVALIKLQFHPGTDMASAMAETVSYVDRARAFMPPGTLPPFVLRFGAGSVPVGDLVFSSKTRSIGELQDAALFRVRPLFSTLQGVSAPPPFGSSVRSIVINADPERLRAYNMSPEELVRALASGNTITPSGNVPIGKLWPMVPVNTVVSNIEELKDIPIRSDGPKTIFLRDVGSVVDSTDIQTSYALVDGRPTVYIPVTKRADASTLAVVARVKENLPRFQAVLPDGIHVSYRFDQSVFVTRAIRGLLFEGGIGALLTGLMVLLFLRDWRSALIVVLNIPLAILWASLALWVSGQTINIMTLGGLALAVGILVDEATVTIENIHTHLARGRSIAHAAREATVETTVPRFLAMVCILAVFIPAFFMSGAAHNLFVPLSLAVGFSMVGSFLLSSSLVPVLSIWVLKMEPRHDDRPRGEQGECETAPPSNPQDLPSPTVGAEVPAAGDGEQVEPETAPSSGLQQTPAPVVEAGEDSTTGESFFERFRRRYARLASAVVERRRVVVLSYLAIAGLLVVFVGLALGTEIFPVVDNGQFQLRLRAQPGTYIDYTKQIAVQALDIIKREVGPENVKVSLGFIGTQSPDFAINTIYLWSSGSEEATLQVELKREAGIRVEELKETLRKKLPHELPGVRFSFEPSDIVSRVMSFGAPTPIEVAVSGTDIAELRRYTEKLEKILAKEPMLRDLEFEQELDYPIIKVDFVRELAGMLGLTAENVSQALVPATSSSRYTLPNYWADPKSGIGYQVQIEIPGPKINSVEEMKIVPIARRDGKQIAVRDIATVGKATTLGEYDRYNMQPMFTLGANIAGDDLGGAAKRVRQAIKSAGKPPKAVTVTVRGQVRPMEEMFDGMRWGLLVAIGAILLLLTAYFQSFRLSAAVILTIPAVVAGAAAMLWLTHTTLNIESFMGTIMAVGVAVANSILLVTFAERSRLEGRESSAAAIEGASSRLRPIVMTGSAMIAGMIPMALGLSEGGEQTAPLARAVIGGLSGAMCATLLVLPAVFTMLASKSRTSASLDPADPQSPHFEDRDLHATHDDRGREQAKREPPATSCPQERPSPHDEVRGPHATNDDPGARKVECETPAEPSPQDQHRLDGEGRDRHATDDDGRAEKMKSEAPVEPRPHEQRSLNDEVRDNHAMDDNRRNEKVNSEAPVNARPQERENPGLPAVTPDQDFIANIKSEVDIKSEIDISDRGRIDTFGDRAQRAVVALADSILTQTQNCEIGTTGSILDVLAKARRLDAASVKDGHFLTRMFSSVESRIRRFSEQFGTAASQIDRITIDLDLNKESLRREIARLDELHERTRTAIASLDAHIAAGKAFAEEFRAGRLAELEASSRSPSVGGDAVIADQTYRDAFQALDRFEKRIVYLEQARQLGIQQLAQIRSVQSGDETIIDNLLATTERMIPVWKQKMILLLGFNRRRSGLKLQKTLSDATDEMMRQASEMMQTQMMDVETQSRRDTLIALGAGAQQGTHEEPDPHATDDNGNSEQAENDTPVALVPGDRQSVHVDAIDLQATGEERGGEQVEGDAPAPFEPEDQSAHVESQDLQAVDGEHGSELVEGATPAPLEPEDRQSAHVESRDLQAVDEEHGSEPVEAPQAEQLGPDEQQSPHDEARDHRAAHDDSRSERGDRDETE